MTRSELIEKLTLKFPQFMEDDSVAAVGTILDAISAKLESGGRAEIRGFGSFSLNYRASRQGRNPKSGEPVHVPPKYVPHFKAGKELKDRVNFSVNVE